jgi:hypothetical protein
MPIENAAVAQDIATADERLESLSVLSGILSGRIEALRRDLGKIRSDVAFAQRPHVDTHAVAAEITPDMVGR